MEREWLLQAIRITQAVQDPRRHPLLQHRLSIGAANVSPMFPAHICASWEYRLHKDRSEGS